MIVAIAWGFAALVAVVIVGFCGYEVGWKVSRLRGDIAGLQAVLDDARARLAPVAIDRDA